MVFADRGVDTNIVSCNKVVLLHGPPGTGKTSLCKALAQKLCVRMQHRYKRGFLIEVNSHSLFSKWFSESGKLVTKMFSKIKEYIACRDTMVCVLIDEVESLAHAREQCKSGVEPSDSIRVVNALLTQIDQIKRFQNVIILTTSNITGAIDLAFVDRADIKQFIDLPGPKGIYQIYHSCVEELLRAGVIQPYVYVPPVSEISDVNDTKNGSVYDECRTLLEVSEKSVGLSGRTLRRIPFLAHALFNKTETVSLENLLSAMMMAVAQHKDDETHFK